MGRCGTQWLATNLGNVYPDLVLCRHEPLKARYRPRRFFRAWDRTEDLRTRPEISKHLASILRIRKNHIYIETGWPVYSCIPLLIEELKNIRLVQLVRHPVFSALSFTAHGYYQPGIRSDLYTREAALTPFDSGVAQKSWAKKWDQMSAYEKSLFTWTEIHRYAAALKRRYPDIPFLKIRTEDLFGGKEKPLRDLTDFCTLPFRKELMQKANVVVDKWNFEVDRAADWRLIFKHPNTVSLARRLGYKLDPALDCHLENHYSKTDRRPLPARRTGRRRRNAHR
jgi:hypothetical protein